MSIYVPLTWPIVDLEAVCLEQDVASPGALSLNGTFIDDDIPNQISFIANDVIRSVSLTSTHNLSTASFTITGMQNGALVTEVIVGPNNTTVYGTEYYDVISSITVNLAVTGIKVGTGDAGYLPLIAVSTVQSNINYSCSVVLPGGSGITYSLFQTLQQISINWITFQNQEATALFPAMGLTGETTSQLVNSRDITNYILLKVASSTPLTDTFDFIFLQE